jgi:hypothetical protein
VIDDTHPAVQARIDAIWAAMSPADRFAAMAEMTDFVITQSRAAIEATMPGASELEVQLRWSEIHYGRELTDRVRRWLGQRP